jgi:dTDP-4-dehydrorhamnose reductase
LGAKARPQDRWARVTPIRSEDYPTPAKRPHYSVLDKSKAWNLIGAGSHWRESIELRIEDYLDPASG